MLHTYPIQHCDFDSKHKTQLKLSQFPHNIKHYLSIMSLESHKNEYKWAMSMPLKQKSNCQINRNTSIAK